jgi:hypothetical protein
LAEAEFEMDSNSRRKLDAILWICHVSVNCELEFAWPFCTFFTQNQQCHSEDELYP